MIDDGFDIGKKDSVRMGGVWAPHFSMRAPFIQDYHALLPLNVSLSLSLLTQVVCLCHCVCTCKK